MSLSAPQVQVPGKTHNTVLKNLQPDTDYTVTVVPVYSTGEGKPVSENGKTCKHHVFVIVFSEWEVKIRSGMLSRCDILGRGGIFFTAKHPFTSVQTKVSGLSCWLAVNIHASRTSDKAAAYTMAPNLDAKIKAIT